MQSFNTTIGLSANSKSAGQGVDFDGVVVRSCTVTNNSGVAIEYTTNGVNWLSVASGSVAYPAVSDAALFRLRKSTADSYPVPVSLSWVAGDAGVEPRPAARTTVLVVGSSNVAGQSASTLATSWVGRLAADLSETHTFINAGIGGKTIDYWLDQAVDGSAVTAQTYCSLEAHIRQHCPDIVIGGFTAQNSIDLGQQTATYLRWFCKDFVSKVQKASAICKRYGVRFVAITPYNRSTYTALNRDFNRWMSNQIERFGVDLIDFESIFGFSGTIPPAVYDSGDGLHINDAGHLAQRRSVPLDYVSMKYERPSGPVRLASFDGGLVFPSDFTTEAPFRTSGFPLGNWSFGFNLKTPGAFSGGPRVVANIEGSTGPFRIRNAAGDGNFTFSNGTIDASLGTLSVNTEYRVDITFDAALGVASTYVNGAPVGSGTLGAMGAATALSLGGRTTGPGNNSAGYRFRNVTLHATCLQAEDMRRMQVGEVSRRSLVAVWPLDDAIARQAGALFAQTFGSETTLSSAIALA